MSGGAFDYNQYRIRDISEEIDSIIRKQGKVIPKSERWESEEYLRQHPEEGYYYKYPDDILQSFKDGYKALRIAEIYAQRINWLLSDDDGEESFRERLKEELELLENELKHKKL